MTEPCGLHSFRRSSDEIEAVLAHIDQDELVELVLELANIDSPPGLEQAVSDRIFEWLRAHDLEARQIGMFPDRQNVVGRLRGSGGGPSFAFNAHMDTAWGPEERAWMHTPDDPVYTSGWREGDRLFGNGVVNDKGPLACTLVAFKAIRDSGIPLFGDIIAMGVCGEIGQEPVDEYESPRFLSKEVGTRYVIEHGVMADFALVAENSNFGVTTVEAGKAFFKLIVLGERSLYTPYVPHTEAPPEEHPNAVVRASPVLQWLADWAAGYRERHTYEFEYGSCAPNVNIGAIRAGRPYIPITSPERCFIYLDVRLTPAQSAMETERELRAGLDGLGIPYELECTLYRRGYEAEGAEPMLDALSRAHQAEFGNELGGVSTGQSSSWRDTNPFNEMGIPAVSYGPSAGMGGLRAWTTVNDLLHASRVYARLGAELAGTTWEGLTR
jgi:acetylornithine deacetylase/succinyl-diaminopimelate desuccinylase-like protein